jgi:GAF domain-containing protein
VTKGGFVPETADKTAARLKRLIEIATQLNATYNSDELLQLILAGATELTDATTSSLLLLDDETNELVFKVSTADPELVGRRMPADQGIAGTALQSGEPLVIDDAAKDDRFYSGVDEKAGTETKNLIAVPLMLKGQAIGVLEAVNRRDGAFTADDVDIAGALAALAAVAIDNASMYARLADAVVTARLSYRL